MTKTQTIRIITPVSLSKQSFSACHLLFMNHNIYTAISSIERFKEKRFIWIKTQKQDVTL